MRTLDKKERIKRGCIYCADSEAHVHKHHSTLLCKHETCPYHELDNYNTYESYLASKGSYLMNYSD